MCIFHRGEPQQANLYDRRRPMYHPLVVARSATRPPLSAPVLAARSSRECSVLGRARAWIVVERVGCGSWSRLEVREADLCACARARVSSARRRKKLLVLVRRGGSEGQIWPNLSPCRSACVLAHPPERAAPPERTARGRGCDGEQVRGGGEARTGRNAARARISILCGVIVSRESLLRRARGRESSP